MPLAFLNPMSCAVLLPLLAIGGPSPVAAQAEGTRSELAVQRLELSAMVEIEVIPPFLPAKQTWDQLTQEAATKDWNFGDTKQAVLPNGSNEVLAIFRETPIRIEIPVQMSFRDTPRLQLDMVVRGRGCTLTASLMKQGELLLQAQQRAPVGLRTTHVDVHFPASGPHPIDCDRLVIEIPAGGLPLGLEGLTLEDQVLGGAPPESAYGGLALVGIGADARRARCLATTAGLRTKFEVSHVARQLAFSYSIPKSLIRTGPAPKLKVTLRGTQGTEQVHTLSFGFSPKGWPRWEQTSLALREFDGQEVSVQFELVSEDSEPRFAVLSQPQVVRPQETPSSVLLITSGSHRADHLGFGSVDGIPQTPFLDRLAAGGVSFTDASSSTNGTTLSLLALLNGRTVGDSGIKGTAAFNPEALDSLAERFAQLGYGTLAAVSSPAASFVGTDLGRGFDRFARPAGGESMDSTFPCARLAGWLKEMQDQPLFVWLHINDAQGPYAPPKDLVALYYPKDLNAYDPASPVACLERAPSWDPLIADPMYTEALYDAEITRLDQTLGQFLKQGRFWDGVIAFTADHGQSMRKAGANRFSHRGLSQANLWVPLILRAPGLEQGSLREGPARQVDVGRSLLNLAGHSELAFSGFDPLSAEYDRSAGRYFIDENGTVAGMQVGSWMIRISLVSETEGVPVTHQAQLFELEGDENCERDVREEVPELFAPMRKQLLAWLRQPRAGHWTWIDSNCPCEPCQEPK
ncbi:MAG: hypothetical protein ACI9F9_000312 [Candidatus Paceibacteria bacterium]|jgi:hypothetical protein